MPDYTAFPVWTERGALHVRPESLSIAEQLRDELQAWCDRWTRSLEDNWYEMPDDFPLDVWVQEGRESDGSTSRGGGPGDRRRLLRRRRGERHNRRALT